MWIGRVPFASSVVGLGILGLASPAWADGASKPPPSQGGFAISRESPSTTYGELGRTRARQGDCKGALDAFDLALRTGIDPELRRDRGLCHEQQGHPWPAIDDYRAYLRDRPNASDADQIRERLARLEEQVGVGGKSDQPASDTKGEDHGAKGEASVSASAGGEGVSVSVGASGSGSGGAGGAKGHSQSDFERDEKLSSAAFGSPLREATGWVLGPYLGYRQTNDATTTTTGTSDQGKVKLGTNVAVGAAIRYSLNATGSIITEVGYVTYNDAHMSGPGLFAGYEARFAVSKYTSDAIVLGAGLGFERYRAADNGSTMSALLPRARLGYRHVFGESIGLELLGDGGIAKYFTDLSGVTVGVTPVFGGYVALVVGF